MGAEVDIVIPFMVWGAGVAKDRVIDSAVTTLGIAPTLAHLLGISAPEEWTGEAVGQAFDGDPTQP